MYRKLQRGVAAVELAIVLPILLILAFGVSEYGRAVHQYNTLAKNVRDAARYLSQRAPGDRNAIDAAVNLAVYGQPGNDGNPLLPGLKPDMVRVCDRSSCPDHNLQPTGSGVVNLVTVSIVGFKFQPLVSWVMPNAITFEPIRASMLQAP